MIVLDTSVAAKLVLPEEQSEVAERLLWDNVGRNEPVLAPYLLWAEFTNVLRQRERGSVLDHEDALAILERFSALPIEVYPQSAAANRLLSRSALDIAGHYELPATYDAHFLALAVGLGCPMWTADARLLRQLDGRFAYLRALRDFEPHH